MLQVRSLWSTVPPAYRDRMQNQPTLLFSWWCTACAAAIILMRICGRKIRSNQLFREDWIMLSALIPLFGRMAFIHFVLVYQTNNVNTMNHHLTPEEIHLRGIGSRLVLPGRIFYAMFIWFCKLTVSEFLKHITIRIWRPAYEMTLKGIRCFLLLTFVAVIIATLTECHPFSHYWQVIPDPGASCRLGYAHLFTMGLCDVVTDFLLTLFPIPIVLMSGQTWRRKLQLASLFSLSVVMIAITVTRMAMVVRHQGSQQYRTVWASCEILASAITCNAVVLGSLFRGKGTRRNRYVSPSASDSIDRVSTRRPTMCSYGSDEDLFRSVGCRLPEDLEAFPPPKPRPAPPASPGIPPPAPMFASVALAPIHGTELREYEDAPLQGFVLGRVLPSPSVSTSSGGGLSMTETTTSSGGDEKDEKDEKDGEPCRTKRSARASPGDASVVIAHDFASSLSPQSCHMILSDPREDMPSRPLQRRESLTPHPFRFLQRRLSNWGELPSPPTGVQGPILERTETRQPLQDAGGLLRCSSNSSDARECRQPWPGAGEGPLQLIAHTAANPPSREQVPTFEDVGGLLSDPHRSEGFTETQD